MKRAAFLIALLLLAAAMALKGRLAALPAVPDHVAAGEFDTHRAIARLAFILGDQRPHPVDSAANDAVRARLVAQLRAIGLAPVVTDRITCNSARHSRAVTCARIRNVRATIGPAQGRHLLIACHYDSTPVGSGAADDGIGVAVALETAFLLKGRPLTRPVTFLFDEGEEAGLEGARAFLAGDPLAGSVDMAINMEARGVTGPAIMFETSRPNRAALGWFSHAAWRPLANSLTNDFYALIPNDTDVSVFRERPWTILNFAIIGNETRYHSSGDTVAALDPRSVRHMGVQVLRTAGAVAEASPPPLRGNVIYADVAGRALIAMPQMLGLALLAILAILSALLAWKRRGGIGRAAAAIGVAVAGSGLSVFVAEILIGFARPGVFWRAHPGMIALAVELTALAASLVALAWIARPLARDRLRAAYWLIFLLLGVALSLLAPGAAIFFLLPPLAAGAGMLIERRFAGAEAAGGVLACLLIFLFWAPLLDLSEVLLDFGAAWIFAIMAALILIPALIELKPLSRGFEQRPLMLGAGAIALLGWAVMLLAPAYSADRKQAFGIEYGWDEAAGKGRWLIVGDGASRPAGFRKVAKLAWSTRPHWAEPAPAIALPAPVLEKLGERQFAEGRLIRFRVRSAGSDAIALSAEKDAGLIAAGTPGSLARFGPGNGQPFYLRCLGRSCDGMTIDLLMAGRRPLPMTLLGVRYALPAAATPLLRARPANAAPQYSPDQSITVAKLRL